MGHRVLPSRQAALLPSRRRRLARLRNDTAHSSRSGSTPRSARVVAVEGSSRVDERRRLGVQGQLCGAGVVDELHARRALRRRKYQNASVKTTFYTVCFIRASLFLCGLQVSR